MSDKSKTSTQFTGLGTVGLESAMSCGSLCPSKKPQPEAGTSVAQDQVAPQPVPTFPRGQRTPRSLTHFSAGKLVPGVAEKPKATLLWSETGVHPSQSPTPVSSAHSEPWAQRPDQAWLLHPAVTLQRWPDLRWLHADHPVGARGQSHLQGVSWLRGLVARLPGPIPGPVQPQHSQPSTGLHTSSVNQGSEVKILRSVPPS